MFVTMYFYLLPNYSYLFETSINGENAKQRKVFFSSRVLFNRDEKHLWTILDFFYITYVRIVRNGRYALV